MAEYLGKITLVNVADGTPGTPGVAGPGIQSSMVYYAISKTNLAPPALVEVTLKSESGIISFSDISSTFQIKEGILYGVQNGALTPLSINNKTDGNILIGMEGGWDTVIPVAPAGWYVWTKTVFTYTNGDQTITYTVAQNGADGRTLYTWFKYADDDQGTNMSDSPVDKKYMGVAYNKETEEESNNPADYVWSLIQGADGQGVDAYRIETNQEEILKFVVQDAESEDGTKISMSPQELEISITINSPDGSTVIVDGLTLEKLSFQVYDFDRNLWEDFYFISELIDNQKGIKIKLNETLEIDEAGGKKSYSLKDKDETILKIKYEFEDYLLTKFINVRYGITKDQATLGVHANGITASIQNAGLVFDASGLTVKGGGLKIQNKRGEGTLSFAEESGDLIIKGTIYADSGTFNGEVNATSGTFTGEIHATSGTFDSGSIGSFVLQDGELKSTDGSIILYGGKVGEDGEVSEAGKIIANNIELGDGAKIQNQIQLGSNVFLSNPDSQADKSYLEVFGVVDDNEEDEVPGIKVNLVNFTADGQISLGDGQNKIVLDGATGTMQSYNRNSGTGWFISNQECEFNNVTVRGSIRASVLEYGEIQAVGGILLVRPSSKITKAAYIEEEGKRLLQLTLEDFSGFAVNDRCLVTSDQVGEIIKIWGTVRQLEKETASNEGETLNLLTQKKWVKIELDPIFTIVDGQKVEEEREPGFFVGKPIVSFGYVSGTGEGVNNIGIGINGSTNGAMLTPQSLSVFELDNKDNLIPRIVLGKLPLDKVKYGSIAGTYGLYAENVLLKGALITQTQDLNPVYCGISTQYTTDPPVSGALLNKGFDDFTPSEILFWAGAGGDSKDAIENAPFFIDRQGNFYSRNGYFQGSIITDSTIEAAEIRTATLTGIKKTESTYNNQESFALTIRDAADGIVFLKTIDQDSGQTEQIFKLTNDGLGLRTKFQMLNKDSSYCFQIDESGRQVASEGFVNDATGTLQLTGTSIGYYKDFDKETKQGALNSSIHFEEDIIKFSYNNTLTESKSVKFIIKEERNEVYNDLFLSSSSSVKYGEKMSYQPVVEVSKTVGYDLYIFD